MDTKKFFKCSNCNKTDFEKTQLGCIVRTEGEFSVNAYACTNCGHIEVFEPKYDRFAEFLRQQAEIERNAKIERARKEEEKRQQEMQKLQGIIDNENSTIKQVREAQEKLNELRQVRTPGL